MPAVKEYAEEGIGLHYNTFRFYDPDIGRFISQDPIGLAGGQNLYAYAPNPTGWIDPLGLSTFAMSAKNKAKMGPAPAHMKKPHMHHGIREMAQKNWSAANRALILDVQKMARKYRIDINKSPLNFVWAENGSGAHTIAAARHVFTKLSAADQLGKVAPSKRPGGTVERHE